MQSSSITELTVSDTDVLTGRGASIDRFPGNVRFRSLIKRQKKAYSDARRSISKTSVAREVIQAVHDSSGRFLKREATSTAVQSGTIDRSEEWVLMEDAAIVEKVKQALRDCAKETQKSKMSTEKSARGSTGKKNPPASRGTETFRNTEQDPIQRAMASPHVPITNMGVAAPSYPISTSTSVSIDEHHSSLTNLSSTIDPQELACSLLELRNQRAPLVNPPSQTELASPSATLFRDVWGIERNNNNGAVSFASQFPFLPPPTASMYSLAVPLSLPQSLLQPSTPYVPPPASVSGHTLHPLTPVANVPHTWREIPDGYLPIFLCPLSNSTIPFTSADLDILWRTKVLAEAAGDVLCLAKIRAVLQAALHLPLSRLHLTVTDLHVLGDLLRNGAVSHGGFGTLHT
jgi:hypothetical protein